MPPFPHALVAPATDRRPIVRFQTPEMPPMAEVLHFYKLAEDEQFFSNGGPCCRLLCARLRARLETPAACVPVSSATSGLLVALRAAFDRADGQRRHVITPSLTFSATATAIDWAGFTPLFVDIEPDGWQMDPEALRRELAARPGEIAGVLGTSTFGTLADPGLRAAWRAACDEHGVPLVVDSAAAFGSGDAAGGQAGGLGEIEVFSFHATKPFAIGEGGMIAVPDAATAERAELLINFGLDASRLTSESGINAKLSELHCAVALAVLERYDDILARRRATAAAVRARVDGHPVRFQANVERSTSQVSPVLLRSRAERDAALEAASVLGVQARPGFDPPLHHHPAFAQAARGDLTVTDDVASRLLLLPCANALDEWQLERIGAVLDLAAELS